MAKALLFMVTLAGCLSISAVIADDPTPRRTPAGKKPVTSVGMRIKLDLSKEILAGLATADFQQITENAKGMQGLNAIEHFTRGRSPKYRAQLRIFQFATNELIRCGEAKNLEGATLAYTTMTSSCVGCHKQLRTSQESP